MPDDANAIVVSWQNDPHTKAERLKDEWLAMSYADGKFSRHITTGLKRGDQHGSFTLPAQPANATHLFLFMASGDGEQYSENIGIGL